MSQLYSNSRIMRRCGQLGIPYHEAIASPFFIEQGLAAPALRIQYNDGKAGVTGWGEGRHPLEERSTTPHTLKELHILLSSAPPARDEQSRSKSARKLRSSKGAVDQLPR